MNSDATHNLYNLKKLGKGCHIEILLDRITDGNIKIINIFQTLAYGSPNELLEVLKTIPWSYKVGIPATGGLLVGPLVYFFAREAKGHGVPEVMEAVALKGGVIRKRVVLVKTVASAISIGTGGSVGREGPIVQVGSAIGSTLGQALNVSGDRMRALVGCGAAAGIAATFNAPIAGSMFALEVVLGDFGLATFSPIVISSVMATAVSRAFLGDTPAFIYNSFPVLNSKNKLAGILSFNDYSEVIFDEDLKFIVVVKDLASSNVVTVSSIDNLYTALEKISRNDFSTLPVVSPDDPAQLVGIVTRRDVIGAYEKVVLKKSLFNNP